MYYINSLLKDSVFSHSFFWGQIYFSYILPKKIVFISKQNFSSKINPTWREVFSSLFCSGIELETCFRGKRYTRYEKRSLPSQEEESRNPTQYSYVTNGVPKPRQPLVLGLKEPKQWLDYGLLKFNSGLVWGYPKSQIPGGSAVFTQRSLGGHTKWGMLQGLFATFSSIDLGAKTSCFSWYPT